MKLTALLLLALAGYASANDADLALLLDKMTKIGGDRWNISVDGQGVIHIDSKEEALGVAAGYNFPLWEGRYRLELRYKIVEPVDANERAKIKRELDDLRTKGNPIPHHHAMGYFDYYPQNAEQWALVLAIKRAEGRVADLPSYRYKSAHLAEQYSMAFFRPNKNDPKAVQYKADMTKMLEFLERIDGIQTFPIPSPQN